MNKHSLTSWNFAMSFTLTTTIQLLNKTLWRKIIYYQTKFDSKRISNSENIVETVTFWSYEPLLSYCDLDLESSKPIFVHDIWLMMMHHNTKFGNKLFGGIDYIIWTNTNILTFRCDLDLECSDPIFSQDNLVYDGVSSDQVWLPKNQWFRRHCRKQKLFITETVT